MGRKGVSIRKPKTKTKPVSKARTNSPSSSPIQSLVKNIGATLRKGGTKPATGPNKKKRKGK